MSTVDAPVRFFGNDDQKVFRIIVYCLSLAFSVLIASLETIRRTAEGFSFQVSWRTAVVFVIAALFVTPCFKVIFHSRRKAVRTAALGVICAIGLGSFLYPVRFVQSEKFGDIFLGLAIAAAALSCIAVALFVINRFLNADADGTG
jgi:hypothetical protein